MPVPPSWTNFENFELASAVQTKISKKCPDEKGPIWGFRDQGSISIVGGPDGPSSRLTPPGHNNGLFERS